MESRPEQASIDPYTPPKVMVDDKNITYVEADGSSHLCETRNPSRSE